MIRRLVRLGFCLVVGVVATVLVAWALLATVDLRGVPAQAQGWYGGSPTEWPAPRQTDVRRGFGVQLVEQKTVPLALDPSMMYTRVPDLAWGESLTTVSASVLECGWPWPALRSAQWSEESSASGKSVRTPVRRGLWEAGLPVAWRDLPIGAAATPRLPVQPIWPGFALDTAVFAVAAVVLFSAPTAVRWLYRRRCGLCPACGYVVAATSVCSECGGRVQRWIQSSGSPRPSLERLYRRIAWTCAIASALAVTAYILSGGWGMYLKGPGGWYTAAWHGQLALGRSEHPFQSVGLEVTRFNAPFSLRFHWQAELIGRRLSVPLWLPLPALGLMALAAWWRAAVRRGLALHWPAPSADDSGDSRPVTR